MHYLNYVNRLRERGLHSVYIKELTGVSIEPCKGKSYKRIKEKQFEVCLNVVRCNKYGLLRVLEMFPDNNPNVIYRHLKTYLQPFNASEVFKDLILVLIRDGVPIANINMLIKPLTKALPSYSTLSHLAIGINLTKSELSFPQKQAILIEIVKYIKHKGISQDYKGYFLLRTFFPEVESRLIAFAIAKSIDHFVKNCSVCELEFLTTSKNVLFCNKCRKRRLM